MLRQTLTVSLVVLCRAACPSWAEIRQPRDGREDAAEVAEATECPVGSYDAERSERRSKGPDLLRRGQHRRALRLWLEHRCRLRRQAPPSAPRASAR